VANGDLTLGQREVEKFEATKSLFVAVRREELLHCSDPKEKEKSRAPAFPENFLLQLGGERE